MRYLALGDSFTIGTGTTPDRSFPAMLVNHWWDEGIECDLRNPAVNGYTTDDLIRDELPLVEAYRPDLVTVLIGANDIVAGATEQRYRAQLRRIHERVRMGAPEAKRFALPQPDWSLTPAGAGFGDTRAAGIYVDIFPLMREQMRKGMTALDGLHPSADAYAEWSNALKERLLGHTI